jgi:hypothetical protein
MNYTKTSPLPNCGYIVTILASAAIASTPLVNAAECNVAYGIWAVSLLLTTIPISRWLPATKTQRISMSNTAFQLRGMLSGF